MMATDMVSSKLSRLDPTASLQSRLVVSVIRDSRSTAMRQRTFQASTVAFLLGLVISLVWSFLQTSGF